MHALRFLTTALALALFAQGAAPVARAQGKRRRSSVMVVVAPPAGADGAKASESEVKRLIELTGVVDREMASIEPLMGEWKRLMPQIPERVWAEVRAELRKVFTRETIIEMYVPIYTRHFDAAEVRKLIAFYSSPVGRKLVAETPEMQTEAYMDGVARGIKAGERIREMLKAKGYDVPSA